MKIEKLDQHLNGTLKEAGVISYSSFQNNFVSRVKAGGDAVFVAPLETGRSTAIALSAIIKSPRPEEGSPRVLVFSATVDAAHKLFEQLVAFVRRTEIKLELAHDKGNTVLERNNIFDGADILIGNPKKLQTLYLQNGFHVGQIKAVFVDDAEEICNDPLALQSIVRICESLPKCQRIILCRNFNPKVQRLAELIMVHPQIIQL